METTVINGTEYRNVSLSLLTESKTNPRRIFEDAALKELAALCAGAHNRLYVPLPLLWPRQRLTA